MLYLAKKEFYEVHEQLVLKSKDEESLVIFGGMEGHVGEITDGIPQTHRGKGYGNQNGDAERPLESCDSLDLVLVNTFFINEKESILLHAKLVAIAPRLTFLW